MTSAALSRFRFRSMCIPHALLLALSLMVTACGGALAGDVANLGYAGFSDDGRYFILEEYGVSAGSAQPYAHLYFIDADKNDNVIPPIRARGKENAFEGRSFFEERAGTTTLRAKNWTYAERQLQGKGAEAIATATQTPPLMMWSGPRLMAEDSGNRRHEVVFGPKLKEGGAKGMAAELHRMFEIKLETHNRAPNKTDALGCAPYAFDVVLLDHKAKKRVTLLKESQPPKFRACINRAEIYGVWAARGRVAVVIAYDAPGFEGPDTRHFVVTGRLP